MIRVLLIVFAAGLSTALAPVTVAGAPIRVRLIDLPGDAGKVLIMLCLREAYENLGKGCEFAQVRPLGGEGRYEFKDVPPGEYVIQAIHDENNNNQFDRKWYGAPKEAYGMSTNPKPRFGRPKFDDGAFIHGEEPGSFEILMRRGRR